jgi:hypothetical protein
MGCAHVFSFIKNSLSEKYLGYFLSTKALQVNIPVGCGNIFSELNIIFQRNIEVISCHPKHNMYGKCSFSFI